ncbi:MAG: ATP-dependent zinc protease [Candidatus Nomurabacteria bacterium]|nr:MAG: ATP-dependent zinc protease [Candidatus Nomurabacteria bacterium]
MNIHSDGMKNGSQQLVFGSFEPVVLPGFSPDTFIAKIDTGAFSGAIHCSLLREVKVGSHTVLHYRPLTCKKTLKTENYTRKYVRSSTGHRVSRYLIETDIVVQGKTYKVKIGLSNRADMQYEILIGRRFLRENGIIVDVRENRELDKEEQSQL